MSVPQGLMLAYATEPPSFSSAEEGLSPHPPPLSPPSPSFNGREPDEKPRWSWGAAVDRLNAPTDSGTASSAGAAHEYDSATSDIYAAMRDSRVRQGPLVALERHLTSASGADEDCTARNLRQFSAAVVFMPKPLCARPSQ